MLLDKLNVFCKPVFPHLSRQITYCKKSLKVGKNTQEKIHVTCLATLLQNELNSDVVCFTTHIKPVLQQIRSLTGLNFQLVLQQCCKNVAGVFLPVLPKVNLKKNKPFRDITDSPSNSRQLLCSGSMLLTCP